MRALKTDRLSEEHIAQAYPIIQMAIPELTFEAWSHFARFLLSGNQTNQGIVTVNNEQDYIVGLGAYHVEQDLRDNRTLVADHFVAVDLIRREAVAQALAAELEILAQRTRCSALHTHLPDSNAKPTENWLVDLLAMRGHSVSKLLMRKSLDNGV